MKIAITAIAAIAGAATASPYFTGANGYVGQGQAPAGAVATVTIDLSGMDSWDLFADADNVVLNTAIGANSHIVGIGWDLTFATVGASWLSEATISFEDSAQAGGVFLAGSGTAAPGTETNSSGGIFDLVGTGLDFFLGADGMLRMELFEDFDDVADAVDGSYLSGSSVQIQYVVPAPGALAMLGLGGLVAGRRRR